MSDLNEKKRVKMRLISVESLNSDMTEIEKSCDYVYTVLNKLVKTRNSVYLDELERCLGLVDAMKQYARDTIKNSNINPSLHFVFNKYLD
jgi:hypothetical protein